MFLNANNASRTAKSREEGLKERLKRAVVIISFSRTIIRGQRLVVEMSNTVQDLNTSEEEIYIVNETYSVNTERPGP